MDQIKQMMELMDRPAFCAENGCITAANAAALSRQIPVGIPVRDLLTSGQEEYQAFREGCLYLTLRISGEDYGAAVTDLGDRHIFSLDADETDGELRLLSLAAQELRDPLGNVMALVDQLPQSTDPECVARINRCLHRLLRIVGNMSSHPAPRMEMMELNALLWEIWDKAVPACKQMGIDFTFTPHPVSVYSCVDGGLLTRAVHNLLSNALKYTASGGSIQLRLTVRKRLFQITVQDSGGVMEGPIHNPFTRFRREPGIGDSRCGLGLGMTLVRNAAAVHGGTVLLEQPQNAGVRVTLSLPIRQDTTGLRSSRYHISYSGEWDPMLVELSDVLPPEFYKR